MGSTPDPRRTIPAVDFWMLLHNPGSKKGARVARRVRARLAGGGDEGRPEIRWVALKDLAAQEDLPGRILAVGGDGTVNAAAQWLLDREADCPLAIVPAGTGNNLARGLAIPLDTESALRVALAGERRRALDAIVYSADSDGRRRVMIQTAAVGFPADIASRYDALRRRALPRLLLAPAGPYIYRLLALAGLARQRGLERRGENLLDVRCRLPGEEIREKVFAVFIGNERSLGGNFHPCPRAEVDDGAVDLCFVRAGTGEGYLKLFQRVVRGEHLALEKTVLYRQSKGPIEIELSAPSTLLADGDLWVTGCHYRLEVIPGRFGVIIPAMAPGLPRG